MTAKEIIRDLMRHLEYVHDDGPEGEGWQSEELRSSLNRAQVFLNE